MGLDFTHCDAHWSYGGFHKFREKLANEASFNLNEMAGFDGNRVWSQINDDIKLLLNHSDCDGELTPEQCKKVSPRLRELIANWPDDDQDKRRGLELADGMEYAAEANENLKFM